MSDFSEEEKAAQFLYEDACTKDLLGFPIKVVEEVASARPIPEKDRFLVRLKMLVHLLRVSHLMNIAPGALNTLKGKSVLDLACGREDRDITMRPWFCDMAHHLGCKVTGVDHPDAIVSAPWTFVGLDLREVQVLYVFDDESFDIVHCTHFILCKNPQQNDPEFREGFNAEPIPYLNYEDTVKGLLYQMQRIKKRDGALIIDDKAYRDRR